MEFSRRRSRAEWRSCILSSSSAELGAREAASSFHNMLLQPPTTDGVPVVEKMKGAKREVNNNTENETSESRLRRGVKGGVGADMAARSYRFVKSSPGHWDYQQPGSTDTDLF